mgnify:CR=1 FL=1
MGRERHLLQVGVEREEVAEERSRSHPCCGPCRPCARAARSKSALEEQRRRAREGERERKQDALEVLPHAFGQDGLARLVVDDVPERHFDALVRAERDGRVVDKLDGRQRLAARDAERRDAEGLSGSRRGSVSMRAGKEQREERRGTDRVGRHLDRTEVPPREAVSAQLAGAVC